MLKGSARTARAVQACNNTGASCFGERMAFGLGVLLDSLRHICVSPFPKNNPWAFHVVSHPIT